MKRILGLTVILLFLAAGVALAGGGHEGGVYPANYPDLWQTNTTFSGDTTIKLNVDVLNGEQSITCKGTLTFTVEGDHFLMLDRGSGPAVKAKSIVLDGVTIIYPEGGNIAADGSDKIIVDKNGDPASKVILGSNDGWRAVTGSSIKTSELSYSSLLILQNTTIHLDSTAYLSRIYDPQKAYTVTFSKDNGNGYLSIGNYGVLPIDVGEISMDSELMIANPRGGYVQDGQVMTVNGSLAPSVTIARKGKYTIYADGCYTETEYQALNSANEGDLVTVHDNGSPAGKYVSSISSADVTLTTGEDQRGNLEFTFTMPAKEITLKAIREAQVPYTFKLAGSTEIPANAELGLRGSVRHLLNAYSTSTWSDGKTYYDLDKDGTADVIETSLDQFTIAATCSLPEKWVSPALSGVKYSPLTFDFKTAATPPTPTDDLTPTVGGLKYKLSGSKAIVTGPKDKNAKKLTIPATIKANNKTYKVTEIKAGAFKSMKKLATVTIGANVKTIGKNAFYKCAKLKTITIKTKKLTASSVKSNAFKGINKKATFKCPKGKVKAYRKIMLKKGAPKTCRFK